MDIFPPWPRKKFHLLVIALFQSEQERKLYVKSLCAQGISVLCKLELCELRLWHGTAGRASHSWNNKISLAILNKRNILTGAGWKLKTSSKCRIKPMCSSCSTKLYDFSSAGKWVHLKLILSTFYSVHAPCKLRSPIIFLRTRKPVLPSP